MCYNFSVRSIAVFIVLNLDGVVFKGGLGSSPRKFCKKLDQNPVFLQDFMSSLACI